MRSDFSTELRNFALFLLFCGLIGYLIGCVEYLLIACLMGYALYLLFCIHQIRHWTYRAHRGVLPDSDIRGVCASIADDISAMQNRHEREKLRLHAIVNRVQDMTMALNDGVILIDKKDNIEWWNKAAGDMLNFQEVDLGHKLTNLIRHPRFSEYFDSLTYDEPLDLSLLHERERFFQFQIHLFGQNERLVIVRDITRMQKLEGMRKDFVANVTHELRTPLTVIRGYLETLGAAPNTPPVWQKAIEQMLAQSERMTALINDLLTLIKLETDDTEFDDAPVCLLELSQIIASDARLLSAEHVITVDGDASLAVRGLKKELHSAISNLVFNAVNYSPPGSGIAIVVEQLNSEAFVHVEDNGVGIDPKHLPRLTERFYRVDASRSVLSGGTGLGLAIVKHILIRHNAELLIESQLGKGSRFTCHFRASATVPKAA